MSTITTDIKSTPLIPKRKNVLSNEVLGMSMVIFTEIMFFIALISACVVIKSSNALNWLPPDDIKLPLLVTTLNTLILFFSGFAGMISLKATLNKENKKSINWLFTAGVCGFIFVVVQGYEWVQLLEFGMTIENSIFAACFFLLIGSHAAHAVIGASALFYCTLLKKKNQLTDSALKSALLFWALVVLIWPTIYFFIYF